MNTDRKRVLVASGMGATFILLGAVFIRAISPTNDAAPLGWVLLALGIASVFVAIGFAGGTYRE